MESICIIIPFYNEARRFPEGEFLDFLNAYEDIAFCLVNDGSTDETGRMLESLKERFPRQILAAALPVNKGKAVAVRTGMIAALNYFNCGYYGYFDADLATALDESFSLRARLQEKPGLEYAFGSRVAILGVNISRKLTRHLIGRVIATFISRVLRLMVYDTQCGAKLFTRSMAARVFDKPFITRWLFDVEILARIIGICGREKIEEVVVEVPVKAWTDKGGSKVSWTYGFRVFYDLLKIRNQYRDYL